MKAIPVCKTCRYRYKNRCKKIQYSDGQDYVICSINPVSKELGIKTSPRRCPLRKQEEIK